MTKKPILEIQTNLPTISEHEQNILLNEMFSHFQNIGNQITELGSLMQRAIQPIERLVNQLDRLFGRITWIST